MTSVIGCGNPERGFFRRWIEIAAAEQPIQTRQGRFKFMQKTDILSRIWPERVGKSSFLTGNCTSRALTVTPT